MDGLGINYEMVLVANYDDTRDRTPEIVAELSRKYDHVHMVSKKKQGRMGWDMRSGLEEATGDYIAVIDGDGQMPVSDIGTVFSVIRTGRYDMVKTFRVYRYDGVIRRLLSGIYNLMFRMLYQPDFPLHDVNSKPKVITREAYRRMKLVSSDWFTDAEIMIQAIRLNMRICQVSTVFYKNERRRTFVGFSTIWEFIYNLFYYKFKKSGVER